MDRTPMVLNQELPFSFYQFQHFILGGAFKRPQLALQCQFEIQ